MSELHTIQEWGEITGIVVIDPDGFNRKDPKLMERLFNYTEWQHGLMCSTIQRPVNPKLKTFFDKPVGILPAPKAKESEGIDELG